MIDEMEHPNTFSIDNSFVKRSFDRVKHEIFLC